MDGVATLTLDSAAGPAAAKLPTIFPSKDVQQKSGTVMGWWMDNVQVPRMGSCGTWSHGHKLQQGNYDNGCFSTGLGVSDQLGKFCSLKCFGVAWLRPWAIPSRFEVSPAVSSSLDLQRSLPADIFFLSTLWCLWVIYFAFLRKGTSMFEKGELAYDNRPLVPNSPTGKVCSGALQIFHFLK